MLASSQTLGTTPRQSPSTLNLSLPRTLLDEGNDLTTLLTDHGIVLTAPQLQRRFDEALELPTSTPLQQSHRIKCIRDVTRAFESFVMPFAKQLIENACDDEWLFNAEEEAAANNSDPTLSIGSSSSRLSATTLSSSVRPPNPPARIEHEGVEYIIVNDVHSDFVAQHGHEAAMKCARLEVHTTSALIDSQHLDNGIVLFPLTAIATYLGYRVLCRVVVASNTYTLRFGSMRPYHKLLAPGKTHFESTIPASGAFVVVQHLIGEALNLRMNTYDGIAHRTPLDIQGHEVRGRYYVLNLTRVMPPTCDTREQKDKELMWQRFRPEYVVAHHESQPLLSDALGHNSHRMEGAENDVYVATTRIFSEIVPTMCRTILSSSSCSELTCAHLVKTMHSFGINLRYLGHVYKTTKELDPHEETTLMKILKVEIVARCVKAILQEKWRALVRTRAVYHAHRDTMRVLNMLISEGPAVHDNSDMNFWNKQLLPMIQTRFFGVNAAADTSSIKFMRVGMGRTTEADVPLKLSRMHPTCRDVPDAPIVYPQPIRTTEVKATSWGTIPRPRDPYTATAPIVVKALRNAALQELSKEMLDHRQFLRDVLERSCDLCGIVGVQYSSFTGLHFSLAPVVRAATITAMPTSEQLQLEHRWADAEGCLQAEMRWKRRQWQGSPLADVRSVGLMCRLARLYINWGSNDLALEQIKRGADVVRRDMSSSSAAGAVVHEYAMGRIANDLGDAKLAERLLASAIHTAEDTLRNSVVLARMKILLADICTRSIVLLKQQHPSGAGGGVSGRGASVASEDASSSNAMTSMVGNYVEVSRMLRQVEGFLTESNMSTAAIATQKTLITLRRIAKKKHSDLRRRSTVVETQTLSPLTPINIAPPMPEPEVPTIEEALAELEKYALDSRILLSHARHPDLVDLVTLWLLLRKDLAALRTHISNNTSLISVTGPCFADMMSACETTVESNSERVELSFMWLDALLKTVEHDTATSDWTSAFHRALHHIFRTFNERLRELGFSEEALALLQRLEANIVEHLGETSLLRIPPLLNIAEQYFNIAQSVTATTFSGLAGKASIVQTAVEQMEAASGVQDVHYDSALSGADRAQTLLALAAKAESRARPFDITTVEEYGMWGHTTSLVQVLYHASSIMAGVKVSCGGFLSSSASTVQQQQQQQLSPSQQLQQPPLRKLSTLSNGSSTSSGRMVVGRVNSTTNMNAKSGSNNNKRSSTSPSTNLNHPPSQHQLIRAIPFLDVADVEFVVERLVAYAAEYAAIARQMEEIDVLNMQRTWKTASTNWMKAFKTYVQRFRLDTTEAQAKHLAAGISALESFITLTRSKIGSYNQVWEFESMLEAYKERHVYLTEIEDSVLKTRLQLIHEKGEAAGAQNKLSGRRRPSHYQYYYGNNSPRLSSSRSGGNSPKLLSDQRSNSSRHISPIQMLQTPKPRRTSGDVVSFSLDRSPQSKSTKSNTKEASSSSLQQQRKVAPTPLASGSGAFFSVTPSQDLAPLTPLRIRWKLVLSENVDRAWLGLFAGKDKISEKGLMKKITRFDIRKREGDLSDVLIAPEKPGHYVVALVLSHRVVELPGYAFPISVYPRAPYKGDGKQQPVLGRSATTSPSPIVESSPSSVVRLKAVTVPFDTKLSERLRQRAVASRYVNENPDLLQTSTALIFSHKKYRSRRTFEDGPQSFVISDDGKPMEEENGNAMALI
eukprot:PhM_4_TR16118/c0_g1_i1/m.84916